MNQMAVNQNQKLVEKYRINLAHIDFSYVSKCEDPKELKNIIKILESGEEGHYPLLLIATEDRLRQIKPDASILNRKLTFAQNCSDKSGRKDYEDEFNDIAKWIKKSNEQEKDLQVVKQSSTNHINGHDEPPVRMSIDLTPIFTIEKPVEDLSISKMSSVHNEPLEASYSKWNSYDPDLELMKLDNKEKVEKLHVQKKKNSNSLSLAINDVPNYQDRRNFMKSVVNTLHKRGYDTFASQNLAIREKELGNEFYKANDYEEALNHYDISISIHPTLEAKNNRALICLKLKKYEQALDDLREVIEKDPKNIKAHFRRGSCLKAVSMNCLALRSFEATLKYDCNNLKALNFVKELKNIISNLQPKKLIRVREITRHYDQTVWDIEDPFYVSYIELNELNKESVEYLYEADSFGCLMECVCHLCPWHEWQQRKKRWGRLKVFKNEEPKKRWQVLTSEIVPELISKSALEVQRPKRLSITDISSAKMNGHYNSPKMVHENGVVNGINKSPCGNCDSNELSLKPVSSVREFLQTWRTVSQKNNYELYNKLLRNIKPKDLPKVISTNLDEEIMSKFLETLNQKFDPDSELDLISDYLTAMTKVSRFNLIVKMLDNKVKEGFQPLVKRVHCHTKNNLVLALL